jgi:hypothetical protein
VNGGSCLVNYNIILPTVVIAPVFSYLKKTKDLCVILPIKQRWICDKQRGVARGLEDTRKTVLGSDGHAFKDSKIEWFPGDSKTMYNLEAGDTEIHPSSHSSQEVEL